jgi:hypothetical protein
MANEWHLEILWRGVEVWNEWRENHPDVLPDLSRTDLDSALLSTANLSGANLSHSNIRRADLIRANLKGANLSEANFYSTTFAGANLTGANFQKALLNAAQCIHAVLDYANLSGACLWETQRTGWSIKGVICDAVSWDREGKEITYYAPGDFERLFSEQNKIKLFYRDGANLLEIATLPSIIKNLEVKHPGCKLNFKSIEETSGGAIATLILEAAENISADEVEVTRASIQIEAEKNVQTLRLMLQRKEIDIDQLQGEIRALDRTIGNMLGKLQPIIYLKKGDAHVGTNYINEGEIAAMGENAIATNNSFNHGGDIDKADRETQFQGQYDIALDENVNHSNSLIGDKKKE